MISVLSPREAYRLWAPTYADETAVSFLETELTADLTPPLRGLRLLDAGCGTGRRLRGTGVASAVGVDISPEMLAAGDEPEPGVTMMVADVRALPLPDRAFDMIWHRLVIGHLPDCAPAYAAGHRRTFRHGGRVHEIEHYVHELDRHRAAARAAGWRLAEMHEAAIGPAVRPFYESAGRGALYAEHEGLPVVLGLAFEREG